MKDDISVEEFKSIEENHEFSTNYKREKKKFLREIRKTHKPQTSRITAIVAGIAAAMLIIPTTIYAVGSRMSWDDIWKGGNDQTEVSIIEENVSNPGVIVNFDDGSVLTVISVIYDGKVAVAEYSLSKPGGVDTYYWSQDENSAKGGWFTDNSTYSFAFVNSGLVVTDPAKSTEDCLYCYSYMVLDGFDFGETIDLYINYYPNSYGAYTSGNSEGMSVEVVQVPLEKPTENVYLVNDADEYVITTPISIMFGNFYDPINIQQVEITMTDGTTYDVHENYNYICGTLNGRIVMCFDRIINIENVVSVTVNGIEYWIANEPRVD